MVSVLKSVAATIIICLLDCVFYHTSSFYCGDIILVYQNCYIQEEIKTTQVMFILENMYDNVQYAIYYFTLLGCKEFYFISVILVQNERSSNVCDTCKSIFLIEQYKNIYNEGILFSFCILGYWGVTANIWLFVVYFFIVIYLYTLILSIFLKIELNLVRKWVIIFV